MTIHSVPSNFVRLALVVLAVWATHPETPLQAQSPGSAPAAFRKYSVTDYGSIQEAIDANPGKMMYVPPGNYEISQKIVINQDGSGLYGSGCIIQINPEDNILSVDHADNVRIFDLTVTRPDGKGGKVSAVVAAGCRNLVLKGLRVINTRAPAGAINIDKCEASQVRNCLVQNYVAVSIEDRTADKESGYAFKTLDGTGIQETGCVGLLIQGNQVVQTELPVTPETEKQYDLGRFVKKLEKRGSFVNQKTWDEGYTINWNQGASITINGSETSQYIQVLGNYIENGAQGFDIQSDFVILANNITNNAPLGMKAMHGSRNVLIMGNQFSKADIHGVLLQPGAASHPAGRPEHFSTNADANVDGGHIVADNIVSDFGYGSSNWIWGNERYPYEFSRGQMADDPPLRDVVIEGNILYDPGRDGVLVEGKPKVQPPRYKAAVGVIPDDSEGRKGPVNLHFSNNIFHPGAAGVSVPANLNP